MKEKRVWLWVVIVVAIVILFVCSGCMILGLISALVSDGAAASGGDAVAVIDLKGTIVSGRGPRTLQANIAYADNVIEDLETAAADPSVRAIVLEVNSPGGGVVASADIYEAVREVPKPIVTTMVDVGASGAYYVACGTETIYVRPATLIGSIGVIATYVNADELLDALGIEQQVIKTGPYKDQGSLYRPLTEQELAFLQQILQDALDGFVEAVAEGRGFTVEEAQEFATGRIWSGEQAVALNLADREGNLDDAIALAAEMGGIRGEPRIVRYGPQTPTLLDLLAEQMDASSTSTEVALMNKLLGDPMMPTLLYLYTGR